MHLAKLLAILLMSHSGHTFFSNAVPPWSCIQIDSFLPNTCLNAGVNTSPLVHENSGSWIGYGLSGAVRVFFSPSTGSSIAVKTFREPRENESADDYVSVIQHEYSIAKRLQHPNIVATYDLYTDGTDWHQIMEYCPVQLQEVVKSRKMPQNETDCTFKGIAEGVRYMHHNGIAHLDLKLSNIMLSLSRSSKIIDFGSAVLFGTQNKSSPTVIEGEYTSIGNDEAFRSIPSVSR
jgi:serine/threonine protein kinase